MARKRNEQEGADSAYEYQNALSSCLVTALGALAALVIGVALMLAAIW